MEFSIDKLAKEVADKVLNDIKLDGKTIREWVEIIAKQQLCGDCISREEAINVVHKYFVNYLKLNDDICLDGIRSLPSATPNGVTVTDFADRCCECGVEYEKLLESSKPKSGHWKPCGILHKCSKCGMCFGTKTNFCPNCGADMRGSEVNADGKTEDT